MHIYIYIDAHIYIYTYIHMYTYKKEYVGSFFHQHYLVGHCPRRPSPKVLCFDGVLDTWAESLHGVLDRTGPSWRVT